MATACRSGGSQTIYIDPGSPWQNALGESFNGKLRDECLNMNVFCTRAEAKILIERYRHFYNSERPHSSLDYLTPMEFRAGTPSRTLIGLKQEKLRTWPHGGEVR
jgi:transposase InsO family protein